MQEAVMVVISVAVNHVPHLPSQSQSKTDWEGVMTMTTESLSSTRELASRSWDGMHVRLLWRQGDGQLFVIVDDSKRGTHFSIPVLKGERPLDVFDHPYAYAPADEDD